MSKSSIFDVASRGYRVYPWGPWGKDGKEVSITDPATNARSADLPSWWGNQPVFSIYSGAGSVVATIDFDRHAGRPDGFESWQAAGFDLPDAEHSKPSNGGNGVHALYSITAEQRARIGQAHVLGIVPGVDFAWNARCRADLDYSHLPAAADLPEMPEWLVELVAKKAQEKKVTKTLEPGQTPPSVAAAMRPVIPQGEQYDTLRSYAAHLAAKGTDPSVARESFQHAIDRCEGIEDLDTAWSLFDSAYGGRFYAEAVAKQEHDAWWDQMIASVQADEAARRGIPVQQVIDESMGNKALTRQDAIPEPREPLYVDIAALLSGNLPEPPRPSLLQAGAQGVLYEAKYNMLFGDSGAGKTWVALAAVVEQVNANRLAVVVDMDHNGASETVARLMPMGAPPEVLAKPELFRYTAPGDYLDLDALVADLVTLDQPLVILDSIQELMAAYGKDSNKDDDFTWVYQRVVKPLLRAGATVVSIDHLAKGEDSRKQGPSGAVAKRRVIDGASLRVETLTALEKGKGGRLALVVDKDRHGGLGVARGKAVGAFELRSDLSWKVWPADPVIEEEPTAGELVGAAETRIRNFLIESAPQKFAVAAIAEAIRMRGQTTKTSLNTTRNTLSRLFREEKQGSIRKEAKNDSMNTLLYWVDAPE